MINYDEGMFGSMLLLIALCFAGAGFGTYVYLENGESHNAGLAVFFFGIAILLSLMVCAKYIRDTLLDVLYEIEELNEGERIINESGKLTEAENTTRDLVHDS